MIVRIGLFLVLAFATLCPAPAPAAEEIVMVFGAGYPPFYPEGKPNGTDDTLDTGMFIDFLRAFEEAHPGYEIKKVRLPRMRMDEWMAEGRADAFSLNSPLFVRDNPDNYVFSAPIWTTGDHMAVPKGSDLRFSTLEDLAGKRVGIVFGNGYGPLDRLIAEEVIQPVAVYRLRQLHRMLLDGRVDTYPANRHVDPFIWKQSGVKPGTIKLLEPPLYEFGLAVQVRAGKEDFLNDLNVFIKKAKKNGLLKRITAKYIGPQ